MANSFTKEYLSEKLWKLVSLKLTKYYFMYLTKNVPTTYVLFKKHNSNNNLIKLELIYLSHNIKDIDLLISDSLYFLYILWLAYKLSCYNFYNAPCIESIKPTKGV